MQEMFYNDLYAKKIPVTVDLGIKNFLTDEVETGEWKRQGLPADDLSIQNGILLTHSRRWPLLIDPQGQGVSWINRKEADNQLTVTTFKDKEFRAHLVDCLAHGKPILIENIAEEVDTVLDPVLHKSIIKSKYSQALKIKLGDEPVDYIDTFRLFMTTRLANPHYTPELSATITIIDFTVTMKGLEDQLLHKVIAKEMRELQEHHCAVTDEVDSYKKGEGFSQGISAVGHNLPSWNCCIRMSRVADSRVLTALR